MAVSRTNQLPDIKEPTNMSAEEAAPVDPNAAAAPAETPAEAKARKARRPAIKDWVRVIKSQGNTLPNTSIHLVVNSATGLCELVTQAPAAEDSTEMEEQRTQVFRITSYEVVDDANRDPLGLAEAAAEEEAKKVRAAEAKAKKEAAAKKKEEDAKAKAEADAAAAAEPAAEPAAEAPPADGTEAATAE